MSIVHDMGESIIGDITPFCNVTDSTKYKLEITAVDQMAGLLKGNKGQEIQALFRVGDTLFLVLSYK